MAWQAGFFGGEDRLAELSAGRLFSAIGLVAAGDDGLLAEGGACQLMRFG